jgi:hypothetical protein
MRERLLGLRLITVQPRQFVAKVSGRAAQFGNALLGGVVGA